MFQRFVLVGSFGGQVLCLSLLSLPILPSVYPDPPLHSSTSFGASRSDHFYLAGNVSVLVGASGSGGQVLFLGLFSSELLLDSFGDMARATCIEELLYCWSFYTYCLETMEGTADTSGAGGFLTSLIEAAEASQEGL